MTGNRAFIERCLQDVFKPLFLRVEDESHLHQGHGGWREGIETHVRVTIVAKAFENKTRIERHRMIHEVLGEAFAQGLHALAIKADAP